MGNFETGWKYWGECNEAYPDAPWGESPRWKPDSPSKVQAVAMERRRRHWQWVLTHTCSCKVALFQVERWKLLGFEAETWKRTYLCLLPVSACTIFSRKEVIPGILWRDRLQLFSEVRQGDRQLKALALGKPYTQNLSWEWRMWLDFNLDRCQHKHPTFVKGGWILQHSMTILVSEGNFQSYSTNCWASTVKLVIPRCSVKKHTSCIIFALNMLTN